MRQVVPIEIDWIQEILYHASWMYIFIHSVKQGNVATGKYGSVIGKCYKSSPPLFFKEKIKTVKSRKYILKKEGIF